MSENMKSTESRKDGKDGKDRRNTKDPAYEHLDMQSVGAASATDRTGLIPANPDEEELGEYRELLGADASNPNPL